MEVVFTEKALRKRAASVLAPGTSLFPPAAEPFFDPALPLPAPTRPPRGIPAFRELFAVVPDPYQTLIEIAYTQMSSFAQSWWPPVGGVVHAEPFFEWASCSS